MPATATPSQPTASAAAPRPPLGYDPATLPREQARHYIPASEADLAAMLRAVGARRLDDLFSHLPADIRMAEPPPVPDELSYDALLDRLASLAARNTTAAAFLGDGLPVYRVPPIVAEVASIRNLTTAYTPYQPERSQGTLLTHWIYQCLLAQLTGFEAVNSSLYDRASALYEACCCALRLAEDSAADTVLIAGTLFPSDIEVLQTHAADTALRLEIVPADPATGLLDPAAVRARAQALGPRLAAIAFPQINNLGLLENVDALTDLCGELNTRAIAVVDPILFATGGLKPPADWGTKGHGADLLVGEGQHLAIGPNFGGPGLGVFAVRHNATVKNDVRATPGRFVGKARDLAGRECCVMVLSTREQHIRKEKATSNICSNQAFLATLAGAALLARGDDGLSAAVRTGRELALAAVAKLERPGVALAFAAPFFNEPTFALDRPVAPLLEKARRVGLHLGVDVSARLPGSRHLLKLSFTDAQSKADLAKLAAFFDAEFGPRPAHSAAAVIPPLPASALRAAPAGLPHFAHEELVAYYRRLGELNVSPDDACYPLGSCTMKYNPYVNDWAANLPGFVNAHPQAPIDDVQGCLEVLYEIQEWFKGITGLAAVTTQPLAGAQGELVGLKMFQAYHRSRGESHRNVLLIPKTAHGTNFATAAMAGFAPREENGQPAGIVLLEGAPDGRIDLADLEAKVARFGPRLAGVMITNPNTCGLFETEFKRVADDVHAAGGLVYMDGANMNAIAGWVNLASLGVDAVHNNLHKTWTIPHGGGGPGDAIVAVSHRLKDFLPGHQIEKRDGRFVPVKTPQSIGSFHRHWGNFAHKVRAYAYLLRLGREGVRRVSAVAVLASRYLHARLGREYANLPAGASAQPRMHEFILTLKPDDFARLEQAGVPRAAAIPRVGKLFLDFGFHAPTVAWPEAFGLMIEPTESYTLAELDRFADAVLAILRLVREHPAILRGAPYFTPVDRVDDVSANRTLILSEPLRALPPVHPNRLAPRDLAALPIPEIAARVAQAAAVATA
ncbi:MAG: aminomethyl-transferring glycine dehydrogenase subunit GcvPB [Opitutales bacterium]|jgi:glycine dehydrogenase